MQLCKFKNTGEDIQTSGCVPIVELPTRFTDGIMEPLMVENTAITATRNASSSTIRNRLAGEGKRTIAVTADGANRYS